MTGPAGGDDGSHAQPAPSPAAARGAAEIAPAWALRPAATAAGLVTVHGLATFAWDAGDEPAAAGGGGSCPAAGRLAGPGARRSGGPGHDLAVGSGAVCGRGGRLVRPAGPEGGSKLTRSWHADRGAGRAGRTLREIAAATGVSTFSVLNALGRVASAGQHAVAGAAEAQHRPGRRGRWECPAAPVPVLPDPVRRDDERVLARWRLLGEGAVPVFTAGARYPWPGCCSRCPLWRAPGCWMPGERCTASETGFTGWPRRCCTLVFLRWPGSRGPRAPPGCPPGALGRGPGLAPAPEVKRTSRKLAARAPGKAAELVMALARRHAAAGRTRSASSTPTACPRLLRDAGRAEDPCDAAEVPRPATMETWVTDQDGDPVFMVIARAVGLTGRGAAPPAPLTAAGRGRGRRVTVCFDRGAGPRP